MKELIIVGASGFGREVLRLVDEINKDTPKWNVKGFIDDDLYALNDVECDYKVIGRICDWEPQDNEEFACALAFPNVKKRIVESLKAKNAQFATLVHPDALVNPHCTIKEGAIVTTNCTISDNATVGMFATILGSVVAHDAYIGDYSTLSGRCSVNGHVKVGSMVYMGCGVLVAPSKTIGDGAMVGIGSVVISNVKAGTKVFGNPAKRMDF